MYKCNSYSFTLIPFKLYRCLGHGLKMCRLLGYKSSDFFSQNELRHLKNIRYLVYATLTVLCQLF